MSLFSNKPKRTDVELLQERSNNIIGVFTKTAEDLKAINLEIENATKEKLELVSHLRREATELAIVSGRNSNIIDKIEKLLA